MLTDIFARRYENVPMWQTFEEPSRRLIVQSFKLIEQIFPFYVGGKISTENKPIWAYLHEALATELGLKELSKAAWGFYNPQNQWIGGINEVNAVCENWMLLPFDGSTPADRFIKERLSFLELALRYREQMVAFRNSRLADDIDQARQSDLTRQKFQGLVAPGSAVDGVKTRNELLNSTFQREVGEINERFKQARYGLNYHNGFIQIANDETVARVVETPFWKLIAGPKWKNVDQDMKQAIDLRDTKGRDPAFYAARALESCIKIISGEKSLSNGKERGAHNYIDNLKRGNVIEDWEAQTLKDFFTKVRNPLGHGPGEDEMPSLNNSQTDWAIENSMIWIKSLVGRT